MTRSWQATWCPSHFQAGVISLCGALTSSQLTSQREGPKWLTEGPLSPHSLLPHPSAKNPGNVSTGAGFQGPPQCVATSKLWSALRILPILSFVQPSNSPDSHPHLTVEGTEPQRGQATCLRSHSYNMEKPGLELKPMLHTSR